MALRDAWVLRVKPLPQSDLEAVLQQALFPFLSLRGARILITGATGFVGGWMLETLAYARNRLKMDTEITVLMHSGRQGDEFRHLAEGALTLFFGATETISLGDHDFTHIIQCAPVGLPNILAQRGNAKVLFTSSGAARGIHPGHAEYGARKAAEEKLCDDAGALIARLYTFIGPRLPAEKGFAAADFIADGLAGREIGVTGNGLSRRSWMYASDMAVWLWHILASGKPGVRYEVGASDAQTTGALASAVANAFGLPVNIRHKPSRQTDYLPDAAALAVTRDTLDVHERVWDHYPHWTYSAIRKTIEWHRSD